MAQVIVKDGETTRVVKLDREVTSIGRTGHNEIVLRHSSVSRIHAQIRKTPDGYLIADFDSRNGISFKGERIKEKILEPGDEIEIGETTIIFEKELTQPGEKKILLPTGLTANEFIAPPQPHLPAIILRTLIVLTIISIFVIYGYIKIQERSSLDINYISTGASFEQFSPGDMFPTGWQPLLGSTTKISATSKEHQDGTYSLMIEKAPHGNEYYTEIACNTLIKVPLRVKTNANQIFTFGGWIKSSPMKKSLAGFKISWFDEEQRAVRDDYTNFTPNANEWRQFSSETKPPSNAEYGKFFCVALGVEAEVYFDNLAIHQNISEGITPKTEKNNLVLNGPQLNFTMAQSGVWSLSNNNKSLRLNGELAFKAGAIESIQSHYSRGKVTDFLPDESVAITSQIVHPLSLKIINIPLKSIISPTAEINYIFPAETAPAITGKQFFLIISLPIDALKFFRTMNMGGIQDKNFYEAFAEKSVSEINIGISDYMLSLKYSALVDITARRDSDILYLWQNIMPGTDEPGRDTTAPPAVGLEFGVNFEVESLAQNQKDWENLLTRAEESEKNNNPGEAMGIYRMIMVESDKKSDIYNQCARKLSLLENNAKETLQNGIDIFEAARILKNIPLYQKALKTLQETGKFYKKTDYAERALNLAMNIKAEIQQVETSKNNGHAQEVLLVANGLLKENRLPLARILYQQIISDYGNTGAAKSATESLTKIADLTK